MYQVIERSGRGKVVIATKDLLPGQLLMDEAPLFVYPLPLPREPSAAICGNDPAGLQSTFFATVSADDKIKYLDLFGPTDSLFGKALRRQCRQAGLHTVMSEAELEETIRIYCILRLNSFTEENGGSAVYNDITRLSHSCQPNCRTYEKDTRRVLRATTAVKTGEELTISYVPERNWEPTHVRRYQYALSKDFTCHCPRCDALGDDTRVFPCCDGQCPGSHLVCHPINSARSVVYTGVEYVEPHLLPCAFCQRVPSAEFQEKMFAWEATLPALTARWEEDSMLACVQISREAFEDVARRGRGEIKFPPGHMGSRSLLALCAVLHRPIDASEDLQRSIECGLQYIRLFDAILPGALAEKESSYANIISEVALMTILDDDDFGPQNLSFARQAKSFLQEALRMHLILCGRETRDADYDTRLSALLQRLTGPCDQPPCAHDRQCGFCEESPASAALKLSVCGRCRCVAYCSVGCQKAHWPVHKQQCKKS
jgi:hypothetical protein